MDKSVYSLVLMNRLVKEVDRLAYARNTSRSNMVNQILAEYLSLVTPEKRIQDIFDRMEQMISACHDLQVTVNPSERAMSIKSVLSYKYNPTVRYSLVLYNQMQNTFGELRILFRTQNESLLHTLTQFFIIWAKIENSYRPNHQLKHQIGSGKFIRELCVPNVPNVTHEQLGESAARYIEFFDRAMKIYFEYRETPSRAISQISSVYESFVYHENILV